MVMFRFVTKKIQQNPFSFPSFSRLEQFLKCPHFLVEVKFSTGHCKHDGEDRKLLLGSDNFFNKRGGGDPRGQENVRYHYCERFS